MVGAGTADQHIIAIATIQLIIAIIAEEHIIATEAEQIIVSAGTMENVWVVAAYDAFVRAGAGPVSHEVSPVKKMCPRMSAAIERWRCCPQGGIA
jgi:hypothetical protein